MKQTLIEVLERRVQLQPNALTFDGGTLSDLRGDALRIAIGLRERGWEGRPVLIAAPAGLEYVKCLLGCLYAGAIAVPAYPITAMRLIRAQQRLASIVEDAGIRCALLADETSLPSYAAFETLVVPALLGNEPAPAFDWELPSDRVCLLQYTSGSTSTPRGVAITAEQLSANLAAICSATGATQQDFAVTWLPPYHDMGLIGGIFAALYAGVPTCLLSPDTFVRKPVSWLRTISELRATITMAPTFAFDFCVSRIPEQQRVGLDLSSLRVAFVGAEPIHPGVLESFARAFAPHGFDHRAFYPCYGLAEATLFVTGGVPGVAPQVSEFDRLALEQNRALAPADSSARTRLVSCGRPAVDTDLRIVDPDTGSTLEDGLVGEIWVSGPSVARGYWNKPDDTRATFGAHPAGNAGASFLRTGDLGFVQSGELFVTGRLKDLIIVRGQNHYPQDIERSVQAVHPALASVTGAAFSIESDGQELLVVVHELDHRLGADAARLLPAVLDAIREHHGLSVHACVLVRRGSIERTASGKVRRGAVRAAFVGETLDAVARWDARSTERRLASSAEANTCAASSDSDARISHVRRANPRGHASLVRFLRARIARIAGIDADDVDEHTPLSQYGIDSLNAAQLSQDIGEFLGVSLPATISFDRPTIAALADALASPETGIPANVRSPEPEVAAAREDGIAIVGMSCRFPGAPDLERFWALLERAEDAIGPVPADRVQLASSQGAGIRFGGFLEGIDRFDAGFFGISLREAERMDPQQRLFLELTWHALEDAGIPPSLLRNSDTGVFAGIGTSEYALLHAGQLELVDADYGAGHAPSVIANRVSYLFDLRGPSLTVDTACSSALVALHLAAQSLQTGECSLAIVGGVNVVLAPEPGVFLTKARTLAGDGRCKTFDVRADGFVRSEGCGVVVLKRLRDAQRAGDRIYAVVQGSAVNHDGASNGLMAPSGPAQERLLRRALSRAGIHADQLDHVEAHGVGAPLSDAVELSALGRVLEGRRAPSPCWVSSVKTNLGHLEAASGIAGVIKTALALSRERIPAHLHLQRVAMPAGLEPSALAIPTETTPWPRGTRARFGGVSAFGIGGTNAHVVLRECPTPRPQRRAPSRTDQLLALSAKDPVALSELARRIATKVDDAALSDVCFSANTGRDHFAYRVGLVAADARSLREALLRVAATPPVVARRREPRLLFAFSEQLPEAGAARELYAREPEFKRALDRGAAAVAPLLDADLRPALLADAPRKTRVLNAVEPHELHLEFPQTSAVLLHYAQHALLERWRVRPTVVLGCGLGEYAAACAAGVMSWLDALRITARRELLLSSLVPGGRVRQTLKQFKSALAAIEYTPAHLPLLAASSGRELHGDETLDRTHWLEHLYAGTEPHRGLFELSAHRLELSLTFGPLGAELAAAGGLVGPDDGLTCTSTHDADHAHLLSALGTLYERGCDIDWRSFHAGFERARLDVPHYPFQRQRCWLERPAAPRVEPVAAPRVHPFLARVRPGEPPASRGKTHSSER